MEDDDDLDDDWRAIRRVLGGRGRSCNLEGLTFGRLKPFEKVGRDKHGSAIWKCRCTCSNVTQVSRADLRKGRVKSCGCLLSDYRNRKKVECDQHS